MPMAIGSAVSFATERGGERREDRRWRRKSGPLKGRRREEGRRRGTERILGGEEEKEGRREEMEEDEQEGPLGIVRGRSLVTRDSCDPDDP